ncbi:MAG: hypothetical protein LBQ42_00140 [Synergistaceae bacterium]|jgi:hypothetical protein|nr:hypothetical protein [Synergistaceae bacterium]
MNLMLRRMAEQPDGGLKIIVEEMAHLPKERDFSATVDAVRRAFRSAGADERTIAPQTRKLMSMSRRLLKDREDLRPVLSGARGVLSEWDAWLEASDATEEELRDCLERLAGAMSLLRDALAEYDSGVLEELKA